MSIASTAATATIPATSAYGPCMRHNNFCQDCGYYGCNGDDCNSHNFIVETAYPCTCYLNDDDDDDEEEEKPYNAFDSDDDDDPWNDGYDWDSYDENIIVYNPLPVLSVQIVRYTVEQIEEQESSSAPTCAELFPEYNVCASCQDIALRCKCEFVSEVYDGQDDVFQISSWLNADI